MEEKILIDDLKINYKILGEGKPLLILHGWGGSSDSWISVQEILSKKGYEVVCPDLPGFGKSSNPSKGWDNDDYIDFILKFTEKIGFKNFSLLGHSFGGGLATKFTVKHPERVKSLILCDAAIIRDKKRLTLRQKFANFLAKIGNIFFSAPFFEKNFYPFARKIVYKIAGVQDYYLAKGTMKETIKKVFKED